VLVVEDEALIAEELRDRLTAMGMTVVGAASSYKAAIDMATETRPNLCLLDIRLRGSLDGIDVAGVVYRQMGIPVVFLTAHSDESTLERAKRTAPFGYVLKPFTPRELLVAIDMAMHRHGLEEQLKASERKYVATLSSIGDGVIATDVDGEVTFMNPVAEALTGWSLDHARGVPADEVFRISADTRGHVIIRPLAEAIRARRVIHFHGSEIFLISRTSETIPIDNSAAPIIDEQGTVTGGVVAFRDVRDRRLTEDALRRAQDELFQAQKIESIGRLSAGIAHDFNNLLTVINGCTELAMSSEGLDATVHRLLTEILAAGNRGTAITRQFLAFGRKQTMQPRVIDLNVLLAEVEASLSRIVGEHIRLTMRADRSPVLVLADPTQIEQALVNLAINARDAIPEGGTVTITVAKTSVEEQASDARPEIASGAYATLSVADTGSGIERTLKHRIFEPYFTTKGVDKGSGLGLASVFGIVKQSGGFIDVDSEPGHGATFRICLPLVESVPVESDQDEHSQRPVSQGRETVLVVEDEAAVCSLVAAVLKRKGYTVLEASLPSEAVQIFDSYTGPIHVVITDVVMPEMHGPALVRRLNEVRSGFRVLYMSGYRSDREPACASAAFIQKPFTPSELAQKLRDVLDE
jgi:two-component system, cell cycle sensor histidine kinase and response regulator CckA